MKNNPVLILPGWRLEASVFIPLEKELQKRGFSVHIASFPGFSNDSPLPRAYVLSDYVSYVEDLIGKKKLKKVIIIAHSFGGRVALKLLSQKPQVASALILSGVPGFRSQSLRAQIVKAVSGYVKTDQNFKSSAAGKLLYRIFGAHDLSKLDGNMRQTFINVVEEPLGEYMEKIKTKTLLIWGADDGLVSTSVARRMQKTIKNSHLHIIPKTRHNVPYKNPEEFVNVFEIFLKNV